MPNKLSFFPTPYQDEMFYSVISRYHVRSGNKYHSDTLSEIFGGSHITIQLEFPYRLKSLCSRLPSVSKIDPDYLILKTSMLPLYSHFLPSKRLKRVVDALKNSDGDINTIHTIVGAKNSPVTSKEYFRYCPMCVHRDHIEKGEPYWHRLHQIPWVLICPDHGCMLENSTYLYSFRKTGYKLKYIKVDEDNHYSIITNPIDEEWINKHMAIAGQVDILLQSDDLESSKNEQFNIYKEWLLRMRSINRPNREFINELCEDTVKYWNNNFLKLYNSEVTNIRYNWITRLLTHNYSSASPLRHILLMLQLEVNGMKECSTKTPRSNKDILRQLLIRNNNIKCINMAADHFSEYVRSKIDIVKSGENKCMQITCSCGFRYACRVEDYRDDTKPARYWIIDYGFEWENELIKLVNAGKKYRDIGKSLNVSSQTARKEYLRISNGRIRYSTQRDKSHISDKRSVYRDKWEKIREDNPEYTRKMLRYHSLPIYSWLYDNDHEWLFNHMPLITRRKNGHN